MFVNNCHFTDNEYHYGHGVALSFPAQSTGVQLTINNCNFISNKHSKSVVYIKNSNMSNYPSLLLRFKVLHLSKMKQYQFTLYKLL